MELFIETLSGTVLELRVSPYESVLAVKAKIQRVEGIPITQQHLIFNNHELNDDLCLQDYLIPSGSKLRLVLGMRGGPINTRRVVIPQEPDPSELVTFLSNQQAAEEKDNKQVTLLVLRDGDQVNFFRVIGRGDGTVSPVAAVDSARSRTGCHDFSRSDGNSATCKNTNAEKDSHEEDIALREKLRSLQLKMGQLRLNRRGHHGLLAPSSNSQSSHGVPLQTSWRRLPSIGQTSNNQSKPSGLVRLPSRPSPSNNSTVMIHKTTPSLDHQTSLSRLKTPTRLLSSNRAAASSSNLPNVTLPPVPAPEPLGAIGSKPRCFFCQRKTGLATSYQCRCGRNFCTKHRYPESHACDFDFKSEGRRLLQESNPLVTAAKLPRI